MRAGFALCVAAGLVGLAGCDRGASSRPAPSASAVDPLPAPPSASSAPPSVAPPPSASSAFGPWVRCYARFRPESTPLRDVTRLAMLCGPQNGMRQLGGTLEGTVAEGAAPTEHEISLSKGQCVRAFAVAEESVADLDLALVSPSSTVLAVDGIDDRWPILLPDRAVCVDADGKYTLRIKAKKGRGRYAVSTWLLP